MLFDIRARLRGEPFWINYDHDDDCRKAIGSPLSLWVSYGPSQFRLLAGAPPFLKNARRQQQFLRPL